MITRRDATTTWLPALLAVGALALSGLAGCDDAPLPDGYPGAVTCYSCHGSPTSDAPPVAIDGATETTGLGVGAHQAHLTDGRVRAALQCNECHVVPATVGAEGHVDALPAELTWGALATADGATPAWDRDAATCSSSYCHGATLAGGQQTAPVWTQVDGTQSQCDSCHGFPPPAPHTATTDCYQCHGETVYPDNTIYIGGLKHIDGLVQGPGIACNSCHGSEENAAPPRDTAGHVATTVVTVGAHQAHLVDGAVRAAIACAECHVVPQTLDDPGHIDDDLPAELTWGPLAAANATAPAWDRGAQTCSNTYCHGTTLAGGARKTPAWTTVDGTQSQCDSCHGNPPPAPHPQLETCTWCHQETVQQDGTIDIAGGTHIDGILQARGAGCNGCHGNDVNPAPPTDLAGSEDTADTTVGAHQAHLTDSAIRQAVTCEECHVLPTAVDDPGHIDAAPAELTWGTLATSGGATPAWDRAANTCSSVYCHGTTLAGGTLTTPDWTVVDGTQAACGTCHGAPPPAPHPTYPECVLCHSDTIASDGSINVAGGFHIDGQVQAIGLGCTDCHGGGNGPAPPFDLDGSDDTSLTTVGAHQSHLVAGNISKPIACNECHSLPADLAHADGRPAELVWGTLAAGDGAVPGWDRDTNTCSNYCHGATLGGGVNKAPDWTLLDGTQAACGTCHGFPPPAPHPLASNCSDCHGGTVAADGAIKVAGGLHVNGTVELEITGCVGCHGSPPATGAHLVHYSAAAPAAYGGTGSTADLLGAGAGGYAFDCGTCHPTDPASHRNGVPNAGGGVAEIVLDPATAPAGSLKALNPATASYTPGATVLTDADGLAYTEGTCANVYCHSAKTVAVPGPVPEPDVDFTFAGYPIAYPAYDVNVSRTYATPGWGDANPGCSGCHTVPMRTTAATVAAGAGDSHSWIDAAGEESLHGWNMGFDPIPCAFCHHDTVVDESVVPRDATTLVSLYTDVAITGFAAHVNGQPDVAFTPSPVKYTKTYSLSNATWNEATQSCSGVACHLKQPVVTWGAPFRKANTAECNPCHLQ
jgi:predicted CxxxxCH...CXXCH cytochrome family protein